MSIGLTILSIDITSHSSADKTKSLAHIKHVVYIYICSNQIIVAIKFNYLQNICIYKAFLSTQYVTVRYWKKSICGRSGCYKNKELLRPKKRKEPLFERLNNDYIYIFIFVTNKLSNSIVCLYSDFRMPAFYNDTVWRHSRKDNAILRLGILCESDLTLNYRQHIKPPSIKSNQID